MRSAVAAVFLLALCLAAGPAAAARVALVIGNADYRHATPLRNPLNDAHDMAERLRGLGFEVFAGTDLTRERTLTLVEEFARSLGPGDTALLFYAGHGVQLGAENYLIPVDAEVADTAGLAESSVRLQSILRTMELRADTRLVVLDACRDNPFAEAVATRSGGGAARGLAKIEAGVGSFIAFSTQPGNVALDGSGRNSPFTEALIRHIDEPGADIHAVMRRVRADVHAATGGTQIPWENSSLVREVFFTQPEGAEVLATAPPPQSETPANAPAQAATPPAPAPEPQVAAVQSGAPQATRPAVTPMRWHYVDGLDPQGDNFLALRSAPGGAGHRLAKMGPGTPLHVVGQQGAWLQVRLEDGRSGWAHGNWIFCCREVAAAPAPPPAAVPATTAAAPPADCDALWLLRNAIWHRNGYCFGSARGQAAFGNDGCFRDQAQARAAMSADDLAQVDRLVALELARGCR